MSVVTEYMVRIHFYFLGMLRNILILNNEINLGWFENVDMANNQWNYTICQIYFTVKEVDNITEKSTP